MDRDLNEERPHPNQPLNAEPRPFLMPLLGAVGLLVAIGLIFLFITWVRYNT